MNGDRIIFLPGNPSKLPDRGSEFLVTTKDSNPVYLQEPSALVKVVSVFDGKVLSRRILTIGEKPAVGDNVVIPGSPTVYLYTNISSKNTWPPYRDLLELLLEADFEVVELNSSKITEPPERYGILLRLEQVEDTAICKIQSVYSRNTLYSSTSRVEKPHETVRPADRRVELAGTPGAAAPRKNDGKGKQIKEKAYHARQLSSSEKLRLGLSGKEYSRMVFCDINGDRIQEVCLLRETGIDLFLIKDDRLVPFDQYAFAGRVTPIHLHAADMDKDGGDELLVSLARETQYAGNPDNELASLILTYENDRLFPLAADLPWYLRAIENRQGDTVALGQTQETYDQYNGPIFRLQYNDDAVTVEKGKVYEPAAEIYSIYQFNLHPEETEKVIIIEPSNEVYGYYTPEEKVYAYSPRKYGSYRETAYPKKLAEKKFERGGFEDQGFKTVYTARRFLLKKRFDNQCFLINKERKGEANIVDEGLERLLNRDDSGEDSIVGLSWGVEGLVETYESEPVSRDIIDFGFRGSTGFLLTRDSRGGYAIEGFR